MRNVSRTAIAKRHEDLLIVGLPLFLDRGRGEGLHSQLCPSCTADSGRSQAAALAADEWGRSGAPEFKAKVRLM
jgi:hypothetical protein